MKKQMKLYLSLILSVSFVLVGLLCYKNVKASTDAEDNVYTYAEYNTTYKTTKEIPTDHVETDTIFAGWYLDANFTEPVKASTTLDSEAEGNVYAKFVDKELLTLRLQLDADLASNLTAEYTSYMRLLTSVDSLNYQKVEFVVDGTPYTITEVYSTVQGYKDGSNNSYTPQQTFGSEDAYRFAVMTLDEIQNLPATDATDHLGASLTVTPRWTTLDGTLVTGEEKTFEINDFFYEAEINDTLTGAADGTQHCWGSVNELEDYVSETDGVGGTGDAETIVITVLKDATITQLGIYKNMQLVNAPGKTITLSRESTTTVQNLIDVKADCTQTFTLGSNDGDGALILDVADSAREDDRIVYVRAGATFVLGKNATLQNVDTTINGAAILNEGTIHLHGTIKDNKTSGSGGALFNIGNATLYDTVIIQNNAANNGGGIYQEVINGAKNPIVIQGGKYLKNTASNYGGVIAVEPLIEASIPAGPVTIENGTFENNSAKYGGVASVYNNGGSASMFTVNGGTYQNNAATAAGGAFYVDYPDQIADKRTKLHINNATITGNTAAAESTTAITGGGAIFSMGFDEVQLTNTTVSNNTAYSKAGCDIVYYGVDSLGGRLYLNNYTSFDGIIGVGAFPETAALALRISGTTIDDANLSSGEKYLTTIADTSTITPVVAEYYTDKGYYYATVNEAITGAQADSAAGTDSATAIKITVLKNTAFRQLNITKNIQLVNAPGKEVTLSRSTDSNVQNWIYTTKDTNVTFTLGSNDGTGKIILDGTITYSEGKANNRIMSVASGTTFILGENATLQDVTTTSLDGGAIYNAGTVDIHGTIINNDAVNGGALANLGVATLYNTATITDNSATNGGAIYNEGTISIDGTFTSNSATSGGAIYQAGISKGANALTIVGGTFENNTATSEGGVIAVELDSTSTPPGPVTIQSGTFKNNEAMYGGVASVHNNGSSGYIFIVNGGTFNNNTATAGGAFYVATPSVASRRSKLEVSNATISNNTANTESTTEVAGGGAIFIYGITGVTLNNVTVSGNTAESKAGCDIAYNGYRVDEVGRLFLNNYTSFDAIVGYYGASVENTTLDVYIDSTSKYSSTEYGKSYTVDIASQTITATE